TMGFLGLFIGPVLMALLVAIWREWLREVELTDELAAAEPAEHDDAPPQIEIVAERAAAKTNQAG
ncbi:MAG: AI-2E family transporter, partial [Mesorhizobium sp.]